MLAAKYVLYKWHCSALRYAGITWTSNPPPKKELKTYVELSTGTTALAFRTVDRMKRKKNGVVKDKKLYKHRKSPRLEADSRSAGVGMSNFLLNQNVHCHAHRIPVLARPYDVPYKNNEEICQVQIILYFVTKRLFRMASAWWPENIFHDNNYRNVSLSRSRVYCNVRVLHFRLNIRSYCNRPTNVLNRSLAHTNKQLVTGTSLLLWRMGPLPNIPATYYSNKTSIARQPSCKQASSTIQFPLGPCGVYITTACS
jgi:hypothetical protein